MNNFQTTLKISNTLFTLCVIFNDISTILLKEMECIFQKLLKPLTFTHLGYTNPRSLSSSHGNISLKSCFIFRMSFLYINSINFLVLYGIMFYVKKCVKNLKFALVGITYRAQMLFFCINGSMSISLCVKICVVTLQVCLRNLLIHSMSLCNV